MARTFCLAILLTMPLLAACSERADSDGVGGVSTSEAKALNEAADMLDARPAPPALENAMDNGAQDNGQGDAVAPDRP